MGNIPGASPRAPVGIELQHKDELPRWNAPAASSPKWRANEGPSLAFDRKGSDSGHLVLDSERRRAEGEEEKLLVLLDSKAGYGFMRQQSILCTALLRLFLAQPNGQQTDAVSQWPLDVLIQFFFVSQSTMLAIPLSK